LTVLRKLVADYDEVLGRKFYQCRLQSVGYQ